MKTKIAIAGAGGKMGLRISANFKGLEGFEVNHVEISENGIKRLKKIGIHEICDSTVYSTADIIIIAIPDILIKDITKDIIPMMNPGSMIIGLDPAAAYAKVMPLRKDITYFIAHPCHPPLFSHMETPEQLNDWFGGVAPQDVVCALYYGNEDVYNKGEQIARIMYAPVRKIYRITVEQMALLEPALVETFSLTVIAKIKEAFDTIVSMGVPYEATLAFLLGHLRVEFGIVFGWADFPYSDGAKVAVEKAESMIFKDDWKKVLSLDEVRRSVAAITGTTEEL